MLPLLAAIMEQNSYTEALIRVEHTWTSFRGGKSHHHNQRHVLNEHLAIRARVHCKDIQKINHYIFDEDLPIEYTKTITLNYSTNISITDLMNYIIHIRINL